MYKKFKTPIGEFVTNAILKIESNTYIPFDPANTDYQEFLRYKEAGGKVYEADEEVPVNG
jgi:hypothetical protein